MFKISESFRPRQCEDILRLGSTNDGGYLVSKTDLENSSFLLSLGINDDWNFEKDALLVNERIQIFCFDGSLDVKLLLKYLLHSVLFPRSLSRIFRLIFCLFDFYKFFKKSPVSFEKKFVRNYVDCGESVVSIEQILPKNDRFFLKIDIEGDEYRILPYLVKSDLIQGLVIEFHNFDMHIQEIERFMSAFKLKVINFHVNNFGHKGYNGLPTTVEITFSSSALISEEANTSQLNLNAPCDPRKVDADVLFIS